MVFEGEVAHEAEGALREGQHWRDEPCVELLCRPQNRPVASQSHDIIDLAFNGFREYCINYLREARVLRE